MLEDAGRATCKYASAVKLYYEYDLQVTVLTWYFGNFKMHRSAAVRCGEAQRVAT